MFPIFALIGEYYMYVYFYVFEAIQFITVDIQDFLS